MSNLDWIVMTSVILGIIAYGIWKTYGSKNVEGYLMGGHSMRWWTVGLSVMATQASAITFLSTPGQAYHDGMGFAQFYFALPIAMIIICVTFIPLFYKLKVFTAYEFLEKRFDLKTRVFAAFLFLIQRGLAAGITIYAPAIVLSSVLGWPLKGTCIIIGVLVIAYTVSGGTKAVSVTQKLQMMVILIGLVIIFFYILDFLPNDYTLKESLWAAGASGKLDLIDWEFDLNNRYNIWSCFGALFLFLSYFGTDQSQVQRYISGASVKESRLGLIFNGLLKIPLQVFILFLGVLVFTFYQFNESPIFFNEKVKEEVYASSEALNFKNIEDEYKELYISKIAVNRSLVDAYKSNNTNQQNAQRINKMRIDADELKLRTEAKNIIKRVDKDAELNDKDYVFINFILKYMPRGLVGLLIALILCAAMSSTASELNALASTCTIDFYKRLVKTDESEQHYLFASKAWTLFWGCVAILFATFGSLFENLIQYVNIVGSLFYGTILGIFLVAFYMKRINGNTVMIAAVITEIMILLMYFSPYIQKYINFFPKFEISFLWLNPIGALGVMLISYFISKMINNKKTMILEN